MEKFTNQELLEVLPSSLRDSKELSTKQKVVLGQLVIYNGLDVTKNNGRFYRSNNDLCEDCDIEEKTLITAVNKLAMLGFIERQKGSRRDGASLYKVNMGLIKSYSNAPSDDNCKKDIENCSNDYSQQIVEMVNRLKELEITVKRLVERFTVIEGRNYSTDTDKDKEIDKDKEKEINNINNNILNKDFFNINKEESEDIKELEIAESGECFTESQAELPIEDLAQASPITDTTEVEETHIPSEDEQYQQWLQILNPYLKEVATVKTLEQFSHIKNKLSQVGGEYLDCHEETSPMVVEKMNKTVGSALRDAKAKLVPIEMELSEYLSRVHNYGTL